MTPLKTAKKNINFLLLLLISWTKLLSNSVDKRDTESCKTCWISSVFEHKHSCPSRYSSLKMQKRKQPLMDLQLYKSLYFTPRRGQKSSHIKSLFKILRQIQFNSVNIYCLWREILVQHQKHGRNILYIRKLQKH